MSQITAPQKIVFCWPDISGYMADCWRTLHKRPEIQVFVIAFQAKTETAFHNRLMEGVPCRLLNMAERGDFNLIKQTVLAQQPDVVCVGGWWHTPYRRLAFAREFNTLPLVMGLDTPWRSTWKQQLGRLVLRPYLGRFARVAVTGERSWQYARRLGKPPRQIVRGLYGIDFTGWSPLWQQRQQAGWPRSFLFAGRYNKVKAIDILVEGYRRYRAAAAKPWPLVCCGQGPLETHLAGQPGIDHRGFLQPDEMAEVWRQAGAFVMPSRFDPWPVALVEAAAAGLPIVCTDVCGSAVEVVRPLYNGLIIPPEDPEALARALLHIHRRYDDLPTWGARAQQLAAPFSAGFWADRWQALIDELTAEKRGAASAATPAWDNAGQEPL